MQATTLLGTALLHDHHLTEANALLSDTSKNLQSLIARDGNSSGSDDRFGDVLYDRR